MERKLLQHLADYPLPDYSNLGDYYKATYPDQSQARLKDFKVLIDELFVEKKLIRLSNPDQYQRLGMEVNLGSGTKELVTFDVLHTIKQDVWAKITTDGRRYLADIIRNEKQDALNESFRVMNDKTIPNNNFRQLLLTIAIAASAIVSAIVAYQAYNNPPKEGNFQTIKQSIKELQDTLRLQGERLRNKTISDSTFQQMVKDSLRMK